MFFIPVDFQTGTLNIDTSIDNINLDFSYYDLSIAEKDFVKMEIVTGPRMSDEDKLRVAEMVKKYCPTAIIKESNLEIRK